ncbi:MAG: GNAT family N-acetyltransferase [Solirubrobacterales bacterium]
MSVWRAGTADAATVARLMAGFRDHLDKREPTDADIRASVERILADRGSEFLIASDRDRPLGICQLRYRWSVWTSSEDCWLEDLYVAPEARRAGLGRALVEAALDSARSRGCVRIELDVDEDNEAARELYRACGFSLESKGRGSRTLVAGRRL